MYPSFKLGSHPTIEVTGITFDSRKVKPGVVFVAIERWGQLKMGSGMSIDFMPYFNRSFRRSPTRRALAIMVSDGLTAVLETKKLPSTT